MSLLFHNHENHRDYEAEYEHTKQQAEDYLIRGDGLVFVEDDADDGVQRNVGQIEAHERGDGDSHAVHLRVHAHLVDDGELDALHADVHERQGKHEHHDGNERGVAGRHEHESHHQDDGYDEAEEDELQAADLVADGAGNGCADQTGAVVFKSGQRAGEHM